ncbi:hypothetical protein E1I69_11145 [Bacillus timonensis]|uniref:Uncharacterized protein n=1 Tax=Bacillus timonensis TaxID=1033734 RepID=A0A4V3V7R2_9BACI|nr:hypothetical protein [Bacillus timonensis]THE12413.1 hypothetical protein E1I69_11145 [Bacillus timonensis]
MSKLNKEKIFPSVLLFISFCVATYFTIDNFLFIYNYREEMNFGLWAFLGVTLFLMWLSLLFFKQLIKVFSAKTFKELYKVYNPYNPFNPFKF